MLREDLSQKVGELTGKLEIWLENDKEQHRILSQSIEKLFERIRKIDDTILEIRTNLKAMEYSLVRQILGFFLTPRGSVALIIFMLLLSAFYFGIDNVSSLVQTVLAGTK